MKLFKHSFVWLLLVMFIAQAVVAQEVAAPYPVFSLAWSEYPSWSIFWVAHMNGIIDGAKGKYGPIELKWGVDIELVEATYDECIKAFSSCTVDAACLTNLDLLNPSLSRPLVAFLPTSTSYGADMCITVKNVIPDLAALAKKTTYGLELTVSPFCFSRCIEVLGGDPSKFTFENMDPGTAAMAMQSMQGDIESIMVWNPFALQTLESRADIHVLFDSRMIPCEIIDMIGISQDSLKKHGGPEFVCAVIDTFYTMAAMKDDPNLEIRDKTRVDIGKKFSSLGLSAMNTALKQTRFYDTPEQALSLLTGGEAFPGGKVKTEGNLQFLMEKRVIPTCLALGITTGIPTIGYGSEKETPNVQFRFDPTFIKMVVEKKAGKK